MRKILIVTGCVLPFAVLFGSGLASCSSVKCGAQTHEENGACVANLPLACGGGTIAQSGKCVPATGNPCGPNTVWDADGGLCWGTGGSGGGDGGTVINTAVRWNQFSLVKPESIAVMANIQLPYYFQSGTIVVLLTYDPSTTRLSGPTRDKVYSPSAGLHEIISEDFPSSLLFNIQE